MKILYQKLVALAMGFSLMLASIGAGAQTPVTQLGFALDASGSVAESDYNLLRAGLNAAIAGLPTDGTVEISVVSFASTVITVVPPTILTAANLPTIQAAITTHIKLDTTTNTAGAITALTGLLTSSPIFGAPGTRSIINLATDGIPDSSTGALNAAEASFNAGIDALAVEAIGTGVSDSAALNFLAQVAFPDPVTILPANSTSIPDPTNGSFVVPVSNYTILADVLKAKVQAVVTPPPVNGVPEPATVALLAIGLLGFGASARRKLS
jgi:uncharacterized protein YegL